MSKATTPTTKRPVGRPKSDTLSRRQTLVVFLLVGTDDRPAMTQHEVAAALGISRGSVSEHWRRAVERRKRRGIDLRELRRHGRQGVARHHEATDAVKMQVA